MTTTQPNTKRKKRRISKALKTETAEVQTKRKEETRHRRLEFRQGREKQQTKDNHTAPNTRNKTTKRKGR